MLSGLPDGFLGTNDGETSETTAKWMFFHAFLRKAGALCAFEFHGLPFFTHSSEKLSTAPKASTWLEAASRATSQTSWLG